MATVDFPKCVGLIEVPARAFQLDGFSDWVHSSDFPDTGDFPESPKISFALGQVIVETVAYPDQLIGIHCPPGANTLEGFSDWVYSEEFPQQGNIAFIDGRIFIDMSPERFETHVKLKTKIISVIDAIVEEEDLGEFYADGGRIKNLAGKVSNEPDAIFASWETLESGKLSPPEKLDQAPDGKHVDLVGTPDWVCEVISDSSVNKDTRLLREAYHKAGVPEYWLIDARGEEIDFQILVWQKSGYIAAEDHDGWRHSPVFDCQFQLTRSRNRVGNWRYDLSRRPFSDV